MLSEHWSVRLLHHRERANGKCKRREVAEIPTGTALLSISGFRERQTGVCVLLEVRSVENALYLGQFLLCVGVWSQNIVKEAWQGRCGMSDEACGLVAQNFIAGHVQDRPEMA